MNSIKSFLHKRFTSIALILAVFACLPLTNCKEDPQLWLKKSYEQVAGDYIANNSEFTEFTKLVEYAGLTSLLKVRGPFTIFLPTDEAMFAYYEKINVSSLEEMTPEARTELAKTHVIPFGFPTSEIGLGAIREPNLLGDYLVTEFEGQDIIINKESLVIDQDVNLANGYIHVIDKVIEPVTKDVYSVIASNPSYSIFAEGLRRTGIKDTLQIVSFAFGTKTARTRFTLLAVPDSIYSRYGIQDADGLVIWCGANLTDTLTKIDNPFYRYMEYHCLNGSYYLSDLSTGIYPILSRDNNLSFTITDDYKINLDSKTDEYTGFNIPESNYPGKNGAIHTVDDILPVIEPEPAVITFETTDYFDFQQGDYIGKHYERWTDGQNSFEKIKFVGDYLLYYYKPNHGRTPILHNDCLSMLGFWELEITTPKIMKGNYMVSANIWSGGDDLPIFAAYVDGVYATTINARISGAKMEFCEVRWPKTEEHKIKVVCRGWGVIFWDSVIFTPIK
jgi:uncharacterized surface protein with fasciclin (FAS1) repeats